jgi:hypothetical protein
MTTERSVQELTDYLTMNCDTGFSSADESIRLRGKFIDDCIYWLPKLIPAYKHFDPERQIALVWSIEDVKAYRPNLTDEQCMAVLEMVECDHDCDVGVSWDSLEYAADHLFNF